jgi:hypothetical protein
MVPSHRNQIGDMACRRHALILDLGVGSSQGRLDRSVRVRPPNINQWIQKLTLRNESNPVHGDIEKNAAGR